MVIDQKRLEIQNEFLDLYWKPSNAIGILEAVTGFGKTFVAVLAILRYNKNKPSGTIHVIVPSSKLYEDWTKEKGHIKNYDLRNIEVFVINTYISEVRHCDLMIADEVHHYANPDSVHWNLLVKKNIFNYFLGLSGSINKEERQYLEREGIKVLLNITEEFATKHGFITDSITYNLSLNLTDYDRDIMEDLDKKVKLYQAKFEYDFGLAKVCLGRTQVSKDTRMAYARKQEWNGERDHVWSPQAIGKYAAFLFKYIRERKELLYNAEAKLDAVAELVEKFPVKTIVFCETTYLANRISEVLGSKCRSYHTKVETEIREIKIYNKGKITTKQKKFGRKKLLDEALELFEDPYSGVDVLAAVKSLNEGYDVKNIEFIIMASYPSTVRDNTQREGRGKRIDVENKDKKALIVNLYIKNSQEEKWINSKQALKRRVNWVTNIEDITINSPFGYNSLKLNVT